MPTKPRSKAACPLCKEKMRRVGCIACDGTGRSTVLLVFRRDCGICGGTGKHLVCPKQRDHLQSVQGSKGRPQILDVTKATGDDVGGAQVAWKTSPHNPANPSSPYNPSNIRNPNHPMNRNNPSSTLNPNNPANPTGRLNPFRKR